MGMSTSKIPKHRDYLKARMDPDKVLDWLLAKTILNHGEVDEVKCQSTNVQKNEKLLNYIIEKDEEKEFISALRDTDQQHLANYLLSDGDHSRYTLEDWPLTETKMKIIDANCGSLKDRIDMGGGLVYELLAKGVISHRQKDLICSKATDAEKIDVFLDILRRGSMGDYENTIQCLRDSNQGHIAEILEKGGAMEVDIYRQKRSVFGNIRFLFGIVRRVFRCIAILFGCIAILFVCISILFVCIASLFAFANFCAAMTIPCWENRLECEMVQQKIVDIRQVYDKFTLIFKELESAISELLPIVKKSPKKDLDDFISFVSGRSATPNEEERQEICVKKANHEKPNKNLTQSVLNIVKKVSIIDFTEFAEDLFNLNNATQKKAINHLEQHLISIISKLSSTDLFQFAEDLLKLNNATQEKAMMDLIQNLTNKVDKAIMDLFQFEDMLNFISGNQKKAIQNLMQKLYNILDEVLIMDFSSFADDLLNSIIANHEKAIKNLIQNLINQMDDESIMDFSQSAKDLLSIIYANQEKAFENLIQKLINKIDKVSIMDLFQLAEDLLNLISGLLATTEETEVPGGEEGLIRKYIYNLKAKLKSVENLMEHTILAIIDMIDETEGMNRLLTKILEQLEVEPKEVCSKAPHIKDRKTRSYPELGMGMLRLACLLDEIVRMTRLLKEPNTQATSIKKDVELMVERMVEQVNQLVLPSISSVLPTPLSDAIRLRPLVRGLNMQATSLKEDVELMAEQVNEFAKQSIPSLSATFFAVNAIQELSNRLPTPP